jgi:hypothetical protein
MSSAYMPSELAAGVASSCTGSPDGTAPFRVSPLEKPVDRLAAKTCISGDDEGSMDADRWPHINAPAACLLSILCILLLSRFQRVVTSQDANTAFICGLDTAKDLTA